MKTDLRLHIVNMQLQFTEVGLRGTSLLLCFTLKHDGPSNRRNQVIALPSIKFPHARLRTLLHPTISHAKS